MRRATALIGALLFLPPGFASGQSSAQPQDQRTLQDIEDAAWKDAVNSNKDPKSDWRETGAKDRANAVTRNLVETATVAPAAAPDPFAQRIHASYQDFFSLLSFAINSVQPSEDGQALAVRLTPRASGPLLLSTSVTITKPTVYASLSNALALDVRASVSDALGKRLSDFDDVLYSGTLSPAPSCNLEAASWCFGKSPSSYSKSLSELLARQSPSDPLPEKVRTEVDLLDKERLELINKVKGRDPNKKDPTSVKLSDLKGEDQARAKALSEQIGKLRASAPPVFNSAVYSRLLDNQPQFSLTASYRSRGAYSGPDEFSASLEFQVGGHNLNSMKRALSALSQDPKRSAEPGQAPTTQSPVVTYLNGVAMEKKEDQPSQSRFAITANYKRRTAFTLASVAVRSAATSSVPPPEQTFPVNIDEPTSDEFSARAQYGKDLWHPANRERSPRFDISAELLITHKDAIREKNRIVVAGTLTVPLGASASIPVSVTWANKAEYLTDQRRQWGAHLGVSYRLPWDPW